MHSPSQVPYGDSVVLVVGATVDVLVVTVVVAAGVVTGGTVVVVEVVGAPLSQSVVWHGKYTTKPGRTWSGM
jgi:hypothetical protein